MCLKLNQAFDHQHDFCHFPVIAGTELEHPAHRYRICRTYRAVGITNASHGPVRERGCGYLPGARS